MDRSVLPSVDSMILMFQQILLPNMNVVDLIEIGGFVASEKNSNPYQVDYLNTENHDVKLILMPQLGYVSSFLAENTCKDDDWEAEPDAERSETYLDTYSNVKNYVNLFVMPPLLGVLKETQTILLNSQRLNAAHFGYWMGNIFCSKQTERSSEMLLLLKYQWDLLHSLATVSSDWEQNCDHNTNQHPPPQLDHT